LNKESQTADKGWSFRSGVFWVVGSTLLSSPEDGSSMGLCIGGIRQ